MRQRQQAYQAGYNQDSPSDPLQVGQKVWLRTSLFSKASARVCSSLGLGWEGPYTILRVIKNGIYVLNKGKGITAHISRIKPVRREAQPRDSQAESPADSLDSNQANTQEPKITATGRGIPEGHPLPRRASPGQVHSGAREGGHPCPGRLQPGEGEKRLHAQQSLAHTQRALQETLQQLNDLRGKKERERLARERARTAAKKIQERKLRPSSMEEAKIGVKTFAPAMVMKSEREGRSLKKNGFLLPATLRKGAKPYTYLSRPPMKLSRALMSVPSSFVCVLLELLVSRCMRDDYLNLRNLQLIPPPQPLRRHGQTRYELTRVQHRRSSFNENPSVFVRFQLGALSTDCAIAATSTTAASNRAVLRISPNIMKSSMPRASIRIASATTESNNDNSSRVTA
ncbi:unnamed protein product [Trichogramma brassicae]|uniref:Uncharacterized protein n=1 Tax=Trichogramma brassicae TaxID=86971 RepID=A0A6H5J4Z4_9HYME|nr:unnamed protein product [Trichogramma brassicae]